MTKHGVLIKKFEGAFIETVMEKAATKWGDGPALDSVAREAQSVTRDGAGPIELTDRELAMLARALAQVAAGNWTGYDSEMAVAEALNQRLADDCFEGDVDELGAFMYNYNLPQVA